MILIIYAPNGNKFIDILFHFILINYLYAYTHESYILFHYIYTPPALFVCININKFVAKSFKTEYTVQYNAANGCCFY